MSKYFYDDCKRELLIKNTSGQSCCLRITDNDTEDQAYFLIKPQDGEEIIAMIKAQLETKDGKEDNIQTD